MLQSPLSYTEEENNKAIRIAQALYHGYRFVNSQEIKETAAYHDFKNKLCRISLDFRHIETQRIPLPHERLHTSLLERRLFSNFDFTTDRSERFRDMMQRGSSSTAYTPPFPQAPQQEENNNTISEKEKRMIH